VTPKTTKLLQLQYPRFKIAVNPEFLRVQSASKDFLDPDRIVIGAADEAVADKVAELYKKWTCPIIITSPTTAELIKYLSNAFLVAKVAYACEIMRLCKHYDVDMLEVYRGVTFDNRIHPSHLNPLFGPITKDSHCLPKDLLALIKSLEDDELDTSFLQAVFNRGVQH